MGASWLDDARRTDVLLIEDLSQQRLPARLLVAILEHAGLRAQIIDLTQGVAEILAFARCVQPRLIVGLIFFADRVTGCLNLMTALRTAGVRAHLAVAGPLPSLAYAKLLAACPALDSVICGEAEASFVALATHVQGEWRTLAGIASRGIVPTPQFVPNLDLLPFPSRKDGISTRLDYGFATIESSRGCNHRCTFCLPRAFYCAGGVRYRTRSITNLIDEIEMLYHQGARLFLFDDEQFLPPRRSAERVTALGDALAQRELNIAFTVKCRADDVDAALFTLLKQIGLVRVYVGVESGDQSALDLFSKGTTVPRNVAALQMLDVLHIVADFRSLMFHPWSTLDMLEADLNFLSEVLPYVSMCFDFRELEIYAGTLLAARLQTEGRGQGESWRPSYVLTDPRAELLRRLNRLVFNPDGLYARWQADLSQMWFDHLVQLHMSARDDSEQAHHLKMQAMTINRASLEIWREMLAFARVGNIYNVDKVNAHAAEWAQQINSACAL